MGSESASNLPILCMPSGPYPCVGLDCCGILLYGDCAKGPQLGKSLAFSLSHTHVVWLVSFHSYVLRLRTEPACQPLYNRVQLFIFMCINILADFCILVLFVEKYLLSLSDLSLYVGTSVFVSQNILVVLFKNSKGKTNRITVYTNG